MKFDIAIRPDEAFGLFIVALVVGIFGGLFGVGSYMESGSHTVSGQIQYVFFSDGTETLLVNGALVTCSLSTTPPPYPFWGYVKSNPVVLVGLHDNETVDLQVGNDGSCFAMVTSI